MDGAKATDLFPQSDYSKYVSNCFFVLIYLFILFFLGGGGSIHGIVMVLYDVRESLSFPQLWLRVQKSHLHAV